MTADLATHVQRKRPVWRRIAIALLNFPAPGAGALRVGRPAFAIWFVAILACLAFLPKILPGRGYEAFVGIALLTLAGVFLGSVLAAIIVTWRGSRWVPEHFPWFSRAPAILVLTGAMFGASLLIPGFGPAFKSFYVASESMLPTLRVGDVFWADMRPPVELRRGDIVLLRAQGTTFVSRLIAVGGDWVAVVDGIPVVNGVRAAVRADGAEQVTFPDKAVSAMRFVETSDGRSHRIVDIGDMPQDDFAAVTVPAGMVFVLGDNRDNAFDSRFEADMGGVGFVPVTEVIGRAVFRYFSRSGSPLGSLADK